MTLFQVIRYDDGPLAVLKDIADLEAYISQNSDPDIQRRKQVRLSLRALEGQKVLWMYEHKEVSITQHTSSTVFAYKKLPSVSERYLRSCTRARAIQPILR